jgi:hypothetical protein
MTTSTWALNTLNTSDAAFRAWGSGISTALAAIGMVQTADTGQINLATVTLPAAGVYGGYEIWRFNDTLQSTKPLFFKLEYGTGATATRHQVRITLGKGSNGSGALTGAFTGATPSCMAQINGTSTVRNWYASSGDGSMCAIIAAPVFASFQFGFVISRSCDAAGVPTGTAVAVTVGDASTTVANYTFNYTSAAVSPVLAIGTYFYIGATGGVASGGAAPVFPMVVTDGFGTFWQPRAVLTALAADVPALSPITVPGFGTYLPLGPGFSWLTISGNILTGLIRWS